MKRYGRGWHGEKYRHYLAGKGIKSNRYFSADEKKGMLTRFKMTVASNAPESEVNYREAVVAKKQQEVQDAVQKQSEARKIDTINMQPLWVDMDKEAGFYMQTGDEFQYKENVDRLLKSHIGSNQRSLSPTAMIEGK